MKGDTKQVIVLAVHYFKSMFRHFLSLPKTKNKISQPLLSLLNAFNLPHQSLTSAFLCLFQISWSCRNIDVNQASSTRRASTGRTGRTIRRINTSRKRRGQLSKETLDIVSSFGTAFHKEQTITLSFHFSFFRGNLPLIIAQIGLVPNEANHNIITSFCSDIFHPFGGIHEGCAVRDVVDNHGNARIANVRRYQGPKALLSCRVPQLKTDRSVFEVHCLGEEVNANGGLVVSVKVIVHESSNDGGFPNGLIT